MMTRTQTSIAIRCAVVASAVLATTAVQAGTVVLVGTGNSALQAGNGDLRDITDPNNDQLIDTAEWGTAPIVENSTISVGTFNPTNNGENWAKVFDSALGTSGPWGTGSSKVCCSFTPGLTAVTMTSAVTTYSLIGYTLSTGNDDYGRRPTGWRLYGSNDGFTSESVLLDTVTLADINGGAGWTANNQVGLVMFDDLTAEYSSFKFVFDTSSGGGTAFQLAEIELLTVPEPTTIAMLLGLGGIGLLGYLRRRRK